MSAPVVLDSSGRFRASTDASNTTPEALATAVCAAANQLTGGQASVVSASVLGEPPRAFGMVMLRESPNGNFRSGTATADNRSDALVGAVVTGLGLDGGILAATAIRWGAQSDVGTASVVEGDAVTTYAGDPERVDAHTKLVRTMPAPGRLAVTTEDTEYRVLRLPAAALAVSTAPAAPVLEEIDAWMARAEGLAP